MPRVALIVLVLVGCATPRARLDRSAQQVRSGQLRRALAGYDRVAAAKRASESERVEALIGAARACDALGDAEGARARLERAIDRDLPGLVEPAEYELAEHVRASDRARALSLYYRAASGAEKYRNRGFPYRAAMDRILQLSLSN